jgi:hypothetical protein
MQLLAETTEDLSKWLNQEHLTDLELAYWIPKYILMWGNKPFASLGAMSPRMKAFSTSQDKTGWRNFKEGCISTHFNATWCSQAAISMVLTGPSH